MVTLWSEHEFTDRVGTINAYTEKLLRLRRCCVCLPLIIVSLIVFSQCQNDPGSSSNQVTWQGAWENDNELYGTFTLNMTFEGENMDVYNSIVNEEEVSKQDSNNKDSDQSAITVYITKTGKKYHRSGCRHLRKSKIPILLQEAVDRGYTPCSVLSHQF